MTHNRRQRLTYVEFLDHGTTSAWRDETGIDLEGETCLVRSIGWVVKENKTILCLGSFQSLDDDTSHARQYIIKGCILKRRTIKVPK